MNAPAKIAGEAIPRPKRKAIPERTKRFVVERQRGRCPCGCKQIAWDAAKKRWLLQFDHDPALRLRDVAEDGADYIPPQLDPDYIVARCVGSHRLKTSGSGATTAGTDTGKIKKERKRTRARMKQHRWASGRKLQGRPFQKANGKSVWPRRKFPNRKRGPANRTP